MNGGQNTARLIGPSYNQQLMFRKGKIVSVTVISPTAAARLDLFNNTDGSGLPFHTVDGSVSTPTVELWIPFNALFAKVTGAASYNIVIN